MYVMAKSMKGSEKFESDDADVIHQWCGNAP